MTDEKPDLVVRVCSHGKQNDGGYTAVPSGTVFSFPACGRTHVATQDKYEIDPRWVKEQEYLKEMRERAAKARAARLEDRQ